VLVGLLITTAPEMLGDVRISDREKLQSGVKRFTRIPYSRVSLCIDVSKISFTATVVESAIPLLNVLDSRVPGKVTANEKSG